MRRPVKPFVTEYRGSGRRGKDTGSSAVLPFHASQPAGSSRSERGRPTLSDEDSYEAAMRAADALFAPQPPRSVAAPEPQSHVAAETVGEVVTPQALASKVPADVEPSRAGMPNGAGRILQAIEDAGANSLADLDVERAPKPRGRRPGSKNKPKIENTNATLREGATEPRPLELFDKAEILPETQSLPLSAQIAAVPTSVYPQFSSRKRGERFPWVRTRLRPGEKWKRRLPKIAW